MSRMSEFAHWLWIEAQLGAPPFIQHSIIPGLHETKEMARLLAHPFFPLYELRGHNQAGPLTVTYGGLGYAWPVLKSILFVGEPIERQIARAPILYPNKLICSTANDITIIESSRYLIGRLCGHGAITLPHRVQFVLDVRGDWEAVEQRFRPKTRRNIRQAHYYDGYEYEISHRAQDLDMFYHMMYLPTVQNRHGELAAILPEREAYQILRHGWLLLVKRDNTYVCGGLGCARQGIAEFKEMGVVDGAMQLMQERVVEAMNYLRIRWAHQAGFKAINLGECWPFLSGIFLFKRKWGAKVSVPSHEHKQIWIRIQRNTAAVSHFLRNNPCVAIDHRGELQGLMVTDDSDNLSPETEAMWNKHYATPGLSGFRSCSVTDLMDNTIF